ncbi:MAG: EAL domain-containing protein [Eubacterium sp.]|nr:EAL domain-containing protein [Eubacterium sp.]
MNRGLAFTGNRKRQVLVVDDEHINREMLGHIIRQKYEVIFAGNGEEAMEIIRENRKKLSLVMLDLLMPVMDGFQVLKEMQEDPELKAIPVIVLTSEKEAEVDSLKLGAADFITKPYDMPEVILARVRRIIELSEDRLIIEATERDHLTGLYTKEFFYQYAGQLERYYPDWEMDAVAIDVEHFHLLNELQGREFGDRVLKEIARTVNHLISTEADGYACRYEADMYYVYCTHMDEDGYERMHAELIEALVKITKNNRIRVRFGIYPKADRNIEMERRFDRAKQACDSIRNNYAISMAYYDTETYEKELFAERLIGDFEEAMQQGHLVVYYQPKYEISGDEPKLASAEALIRWIHPEFGMVSPEAFIPLFETNGLIQQLDLYVWKQAAAQIAKWKKEYGVTVPVSVNVSRMDMYDPNLQTNLLQILRENGLSSEEYLLEVTESAYAEDSRQLIEVVDKLRSKGFRVEMDDFGSGYSSLNMLTTLPIDVLKLDMVFVKNVHTDEKALRLVELIMEIARYLGVTVVAEGVEYVEQYELLKKCGCDVIQGYYFSKPLPPEEWASILIKEKAR